jgi:hypothetical protein
MSSFSTRGRDRSDQIGGGVYSEAGREKERGRERESVCVCGCVCAAHAKIETSPSFIHCSRQIVNSPKN